LPIIDEIDLITSNVFIDTLASGSAFGPVNKAETVDAIGCRDGSHGRAAKKSANQREGNRRHRKTNLQTTTVASANFRLNSVINTTVK